MKKNNFLESIYKKDLKIVKNIKFYSYKKIEFNNKTMFNWNK